MFKYFSRRYQPIRVALLLVAGSVTILVARARHIENQQPQVAVTPAPELVGTTWLNTPGGRPVTLASRLGKVTMVEFWTFMCSNCRANLPAYERWQKKYEAQGFSIVSVHTPEIKEEYDPAHVKKFIQEQGITYPVLLDNKYKNWHRWNQEFWPVIYLLDKKGQIRSKWIGELNSMASGGEQKVASQIEKLLAE